LKERKKSYCRSKRIGRKQNCGQCHTRAKGGTTPKLTLKLTNPRNDSIGFGGGKKGPKKIKKGGLKGNETPKVLNQKQKKTEWVGGGGGVIQRVIREKKKAPDLGQVSDKSIQ